MRALAAHQRIGDLRTACRGTLINLGVGAYYQSRWTEAAQLLRRGCRCRRACRQYRADRRRRPEQRRDPVRPGTTGSGRSKCSRSGLRNYEAVGYPVGIVAARLFSAVAAMRLGDTGSAQARLDAAQAAMTRLGTRSLRRSGVTCARVEPADRGDRAGRVPASSSERLNVGRATPPASRTVALRSIDSSLAAVTQTPLCIEGPRRRSSSRPDPERVERIGLVRSQRRACTWRPGRHEAFERAQRDRLHVLDAGSRRTPLRRMVQVVVPAAPVSSARERNQDVAPTVGSRMMATLPFRRRRELEHGHDAIDEVESHRPSSRRRPIRPRRSQPVRRSRSR